MHKTVVTLLMLAYCLLSCTNDDSGPGPSKGFATGKVVDAQGKPLAGVRILLRNTLIYNSFLEGNTDQDGNYRISTNSAGSSFTYIAYAEIERDYNGRHYKLDLKPDNTAGFAGAEGAVRNFQWLLSGRDAHNPNSFYGGTVSFDSDIHSQIYDAENLEFTFTPVGTLIDGSTGQVIKRQLNAETNNEMRDIPIGSYRITGIYKPTGKVVKLKTRPNGTYSADGSVTADFYGTSGPWACTNCISLEYLEAN